MADLLHDDPREVLKDLGSYLKILDEQFIGMIARRLALAREVGFAKFRQKDEAHPFGQDIFRPEIEDQRLDGIVKAAEKYGVNPHFARAILYMLINEACKIQMAQLQEGEFGWVDVEYDTLKQNLLDLTARVAVEYDASYDRDHPATRNYLRFEAEVVRTQIEGLDGRSMALDLGCATGNLTLALVPHFEHVVGVDLSPDMVEVAARKASSGGHENARFIQGDLESEEPWSHFMDESFQLVTMGLGTAGDMRELRRVIGKIKRVLSPGGRFVLSFYNADALIYRWPFIPWPSSLAAVIDPDRRCLDVHLPGNKAVPIYARAYTADEVDDLIGGSLQVTRTYTHPSFAALLPREMVLDPQIGPSIAEIDRDRALNSETTDGAYLIAVGRKS